MEKITSFINNFKSVVVILILGLVIFGVILSKTIPLAQKIIGLDADCKSASQSLEDKNRTLANLESKSKEKPKDDKNVQLKAFYKPIEQGLDPEMIISSAFAHILEIMNDYSIKARSIQYEYQPLDDNFVKNAGDKYNVATLDAEMIGTYKNFESFLKEVYKHEHFLNISSIEIVPYTKDKKILVIKFKLRLYAQK